MNRGRGKEKDPAMNPIQSENIGSGRSANLPKIPSAARVASV